MSVSSFILGGSLEKLPARFHLSGGLLGMITALAADTPEISSAITALFVKQHDIGIGIIIGSNIFNLAALLGLSALITGRIPLKRQGIIFNGATSLLVTLIAILLILKFIAPLVSVILLTILLIPYIFILTLNPDRLKQWKLQKNVRAFLAVAISSTRNTVNRRKIGIWKAFSGRWAIGISTVMIVLTSMGMVHAAVFLSDAWKVDKIIVGMFILAILTSIPNTITAIKLALYGNETAVLSESLNSNTINILFGIAVSSAILGLGSLQPETIFSIWWLLGMTIIALLLLYFKKGSSRISGAITIGLYLIFVVIICIWR